MTEHEWQVMIRSLREGSPEGAGPSVETKLIAAFRARHGRTRVWRSAGILAASLALAAGLYLGWSHSRVKKPNLPAEMAGFIALPYSQSGVPLEQAVIVRMSVPASTLASMGMPLPLDPEKNVDAEVLVGQDGVARAVRILQ